MVLKSRTDRLSKSIMIVQIVIGEAGTLLCMFEVGGSTQVLVSH